MEWIIVFLAVFHAVWLYMYVCKKIFFIKNRLWVEPVFAWYDLWIGLFWKKTPHLWYHVYLFVIPMLGFSIKIRKPSRKGKKHWFDFLEMSNTDVEEMMESMFED